MSILLRESRPISFSTIRWLAALATNYILWFFNFLSLGIYFFAMDFDAVWSINSKYNLPSLVCKSSNQSRQMAVWFKRQFSSSGLSYSGYRNASFVALPKCQFDRFPLIQYFLTPTMPSTSNCEICCSRRVRRDFFRWREPDRVASAWRRRDIYELPT